ncbi:MAG: hypothetical protein AW07_02801 [Candidatus Accumulibacter sp. SK-11]|nr:MAG: hypothetical protein AW07_02801 [Candidatus Accumulibacter sp. SK-11]
MPGARERLARNSCPAAARGVAGGEVVICFAGQTAGYDRVLNLIEPTGFLGNPFFHNHQTAVGTALSLGTYAAGTVLRFRMDVLSTGDKFFTGPGTGNADGLVHVGHATWAADGVIPVDGLWVGFEDILGGGDRDYDDNRFVFTNVRSDVPEPGSLALLAEAALAAPAAPGERPGRPLHHGWRSPTATTSSPSTSSTP